MRCWTKLWSHSCTNNYTSFWFNALCGVFPCVCVQPSPVSLAWLLHKPRLLHWCIKWVAYVPVFCCCVWLRVFSQRTLCCRGSCFVFPAVTKPEEEEEKEGTAAGAHQLCSFVFVRGFHFCVEDDETNRCLSLPCPRVRGPLKVPWICQVSFIKDKTRHTFINHRRWNVVVAAE